MSTKVAAAKDDHATDNDVNQNTENKEVCMFLYTTYVRSYVHNFKEWYIHSFHGFLEDLRITEKVLHT